MKPIRVKAPAVLPVSLDELKQAARVDFDDDDAILMTYLQAAVEHLDGWDGILGRAIINPDWQIFENGWPTCRDYGYGYTSEGTITLPFGDVSQATIRYYKDGLQKMLDPARYEIIEIATGAVIHFKCTLSLPILALGDLRQIEITFTTGYGDDAADVPASIKVAIMLLATHWYENREAVTGRNLTRLPFAVDRLITPHRRRLF